MQTNYAISISGNFAGEAKDRRSNYTKKHNNAWYEEYQVIATLCLLIVELRVPH